MNKKLGWFEAKDDEGETYKINVWEPNKIVVRALSGNIASETKKFLALDNNSRVYALEDIEKGAKLQVDNGPILYVSDLKNSHTY
tara:strand:- start:605 stop:859 length:255 start_codon:yes stop_codon:yes gene_type:complete